MQLSAAFIKGAQFAIGANQLAQDAKAKKDEEIHWRTIGEGEEARAVPIDGPDPKAKKAAEAKKPEGKKAEGKAAQPKKAETKDKKATAGKLKYNINDTRKALRDGVNASHVSRADEIKWNDARRQMGETIKATKIQENAMTNLIDGALEDEELTTAQAKKLKDKLKDVQKDMPELIKQAEDAIEAVKNKLMNDRDLEGKIESLDNAARRALKIHSAVVHVGSDLRQYKSETAQKRQEEIAQRMQRENLGSNNTESKKAAEPKKTEGKAAQPRAEGNRGTKSSRTSRKETALEKRIKDALRKKIPGTDKYTESNIKDSLEKIGKHIPLFNESMAKIKEQISDKEKNGTFDRARVDAELRRRRAYMDAFAGYLTQANDTINNLDKTTNDEHQKDRGALMNLALYTAKLTREALLWRDDVHSVSTDLDNVTVWS